MQILHIQPTRSGQLRAAARGFTTIELMVTLCITAVLAALSAPSFTLMIENWRVREATEQLQSSLYLARSEAIKRGGYVVIQKISNKTNSCLTAKETRDWDCGWVICHDINNNGNCNPTEPVLLRVETSAQVHISRTGGGANIKINRWGLVDGTWLGFNLTPLTRSLGHPAARGVCMSSGGRIRVIPQEDIPCTA